MTKELKQGLTHPPQESSQFIRRFRRIMCAALYYVHSSYAAVARGSVPGLAMCDGPGLGCGGSHEAPTAP